MRIAVVGGTGLIGSHVCKALVACGCVVTSLSRGGDGAIGSAAKGASQKPLARFDGEQWLSQVNWMQVDANVEGTVSAALTDGVDGVVSCIGSADLLTADQNGWASGWSWSERSKRHYAEHYEPSAQIVAAAKAAGAQRFVYIGVSSDAEQGFGGPNPGLYTGKRSAALAALDSFGDAFTYFGPHLVVERNDDFRMKASNSGLWKGLRSFNDLIGEIRSFGPDYTTKTRLTPPVLASDLAIAIAATVTGRIEVEESVRSAGMTTFSEVKEKEQERIEDLMRHVDGSEAITELARRAEASGVSWPASGVSS